MKYNNLGKTGMSVSRLGFGCIKFKEESQKTVNKALNMALDNSINFFDTARGYGPSEEMIGAAIAHRRSEYYIATKTKETGYKEAVRDIETSLKNLRTDRIDLYQLHSISTPEKWQHAVEDENGSLRALLEASEKGTVGHIGITIHRSVENMKLAIDHGIFETIMLLYNIIDEEDVGSEIMPRADRAGLGTVIMKAIGGGRFSECSGNHGNGRNIAVEMCLRFVLNNRHMHTVIAGMRNEREVMENLETEAMPPLGESEHLKLLRMIRQQFDTFRYEQRCMQCGYCLPCPESIEIPKVLRVVAFQKSDRVPPEEAARIASSLKKGPEACSKCGKCVKSCPAEIDIPKIMEDEEKTFQDAVNR